MEEIRSEGDLVALLNGKTAHSKALLNHFIAQFQQVGPIRLYPTKSMLGIATSHGRIAWITQIGKGFIHVVFPFQQPYVNNLCFQKIAQVPGDERQYNHHFRMEHPEDVNEEIHQFMKLALQ